MSKKRLIASIIEFLNEELKCDALSSDSKESIEVSIQCLETAYDVNPVDQSLKPSRKLLEIFEDAVGKDNISPKRESESVSVSAEARQRAESLKNEGNDLMKSERFNEALQCYSKAIEIDSTNAVYYCNRAAAYSKLNNHSSALDDCKMAINYDASYSKAYGRMGLAYASLNDHHRARDCYKKAVELDPQNESYRNNLRIAEDKMNEQSPPFAMGGMPFDIGSLINNPALMNMATQLMNDPNMQNLMGGLMSGAVNNSGAAGGESRGTGIDALLQAGQQIAAQMQASNPELVEQLRTAMTRGQQNDGSPENNANDQQPDNPENKKDL